MKVYDELVARGLIAQVSDEEEIKELVNNGKAVFLFRCFEEACKCLIMIFILVLNT